MYRRRNWAFLCLLLAGILPCWKASAQFQQLPTPKKSPDHQALSLRLLEERLSLPFWDDFSSGAVREDLWDSRGVLGSMTLGNNPPSIGVCYLDGVDQRGEAYARELLENGEGDRLTSKPIDLSGLSTAEAATVYLSFFWQAAGKGEMPDDNDQLELHFLNEQGEWELVWQVIGGDEGATQDFTQEILQVTEAFQHDQFRFRFLHIGRLSGPFDTWVLDYIYLNKGRSESDLFYEDRTLTQLPSSPFGKYGAIPLFELTQKSEEYLSPLSGQFKNLSNRFRAMEFTVQFRNLQTGAVIQNINVNTPLSPVPQAGERRGFTSFTLQEDIDWQEEEPFDLEALMYLSTGDRFKVESISGRDTVFNTSMDYKVNDTVRYILPVRDYLAYDNGSVDYSAGINQRAGMLALRYEIGTPVFIKGISINFTNFMQRGRSVELMVWDSLGQEPLYKREVLIPELEDLGEFAYFPLGSNIQVSGTFYVGFTQFTNDFVYVGLDKSSDSGEQVFYNVSGAWQQNETVSGNLMIRPHLSLGEVVDEEEEEPEEEVRAYPNPVVERLYLESGSDLDELAVYDFQGRQVPARIENFEKGKIIHFEDRQKGIYLIRFRQKDKIKSVRILVK
ncbi:T9SS type A sorting domain-containing protein [Pleomorphovibrio marinus]|uniref:T9SS type A sorting domain-containing protein n=1 Tax=Pleomorphovibrio marinus TaxID=2164132 RepID=UPI000E0A6852|nr:T9SS type A sorting domain-containing protein [Pleomorphovibrio marinus]